MDQITKLLIRFFWLAFLLLVAASLVRTLLLSREARQRIREQEETVHTLQQEVQLLEEQVQTATTSFELERRAREELRLQYPHETIFRLE